MKKTLLSITCLMAYISYAQAEQPITSILKSLSEAIVEVQTEKYTYEQSFQPDLDQPYHFVLSNTATSSKGKSETMRYEFNLAHLNANGIYRDSGKEMKIGLKTKNNQKAIKVYKDDEQQKFEDEVFIYCNDVDASRDIMDLLGEVIPLASDIWKEEAKLPEDLNGLSTWITGHISNVSQGDKELEQTFQTNNSPEMVKLQVERTNQKGDSETQTFQWNMADLNPSFVNLQVKGNSIGVLLKTDKKQNFIAVYEEGQLSEYDNNLLIAVNDMNEAELLIKALKEIIPLCQKSVAEKLPKTEDKQEVLDLLASQFQAFSNGEDAYNFELEATCLTELMAEKNGKKGTETVTYFLDLSDLKNKGTAIKISKNTIKLIAATDKKKPFIQRRIEDKITYEQRMEWLVPDVETYRIVNHLLPKAIKACERDIETKNFSWLASKIKETAQENVSQELDQADSDSPCKWVYTRSEQGKKGTEDHTYEWNMYDLNPKSSTFKIQKDQAILVLKTKHNEDIIKYFNSDGKSEFVNEIIFTLPNVPDGKIAKQTAISLIEGCKE